MQITINIKDKDITEALENKVQWDITEEFSDLALAALCVTEASAVKVLREDAKFLADLEKRLGRALTECVDEVLSDCAYEAASPALKKLATQLDKSEKAIDKQAAVERKLREEREEAERVGRTIETLTRMGYKITKE